MNQSVSSGLPSLDRITNGFNPSELIIVSGRPGNGIDAFTSSILVNVAYSARIPTLVFAFETRPTEIPRRLTANIEKRSLKSILKNKDLGSLILVETVPPSHFLFGQTLRETVLKNEVKLVLIDIIPQNLLKNSRFLETENLNHIISKLKSIAISLNVPIIISHKLHVSNSRVDIFPSMKDLPEPFKEHGDVFISIFRPDLYNLSTTHIGNTELLIEFNSTGRKELSYLNCNPEIFEMTEV